MVEIKIGYWPKRWSRPTFIIRKNEKTLKDIYVKKFQKHAIFTHDLLRLAKKVDLKINEEQEECLDEITTFNINARYDNYKKNFNKLCTRDFAQRPNIRNHTF